MRILILTLVLVFSGITKVLAQDIHFSMFNASPLTLNPANTGMFHGDFRVANIYRTQWRAIGDPLNTLAVSYDQQVYALPHNISAGLIFTSDKSGGIELTDNRILLSAGIKHFRGKDILSGGLQIGVGFKNFNIGDATFPEQYSREIGGFDPNLPSGESNIEWSTTYLDINAGVVYQKVTGKGLLNGGVSIFHLNNPDDSFYRSGDRLRPRLVVHGDYDYALNRDWSIKPTFLMMTLSKAQDFIFSTSAGIRIKDESKDIRKLWFGLGVRTGINRNGDAFFPTIGADFKHFQFAAGYDVNFSDLNVATNKRGAFEVSLIYTSPSSAINKVVIPCDRF